MSIVFGERRLPVLHRKFQLPVGADDLLGRNTIHVLGPDAHEILAAAGDDRCLEAIGPEVGEQFKHRLIDAISVGALEARMPIFGDPVLDALVELLRGHPRMSQGDDAEQSLSVIGEECGQVALLEGLNRRVVVPFGMIREQSCDFGTEANANWKGTGFSGQSVPSLSKTAIRSETGTKSADPSFVTFSTKATMAFFERSSFQDGSGSVWAAAGRSVPAAREEAIMLRRASLRAMAAMGVNCAFIVLLVWWVGSR